jgi:hypothetical protein
MFHDNCDANYCAVYNEGVTAGLLPIVGGQGIITTAPTDDSWLENKASGDYRINATGQAALQGQGWNGSDIASAFYVIVEESSDIAILASITGSGNLSLFPLPDKFSTLINSASGDLLTNIVVNKNTVAANTGAGDLNSTVEVGKQLINALVSGGGSLNLSLEAILDILKSLSVTGSGSLSAELLADKITLLSDTGSGDLAVTLLKGCEYATTSSANGDLVSTISKGISTNFVNSAGGSIDNTISISKILDNLVIDGNGYTAISVDIDKTTVTSVSASGSILDYLDVDKSVDVTVSLGSEGLINTSVVKDFAGNNIIVIPNTILVGSTSITNTLKVDNTTKTYTHVVEDVKPRSKNVNT